MNVHVVALESETALTGELDAICASRAFRHSPQQQRLLRHLVARLENGDLTSLREMALGIDVFRRPAADFDPKKDPIVRVEMGRLRERLARWYGLEGTHSAIEIVVPIGSYVPVVRPRAVTRPVAFPTPSQARKLLERAWYVMRLRTIEGNRKALQLFTRASLEHPQCADAYQGIAWARICIAGFEGVPPEAGHQRDAIRAAIDRARALEPQHAHLDVLDGAYAFRFEHQVRVAEAHHRAALSRSPSDPILLGSFGWLFALTGRFAEAQQFFDGAYAREPFGFWHRHNLASLAYLRHDFDIAEMLLREALDIEPDHIVTRMLLARVLHCMRRGDEAIVEAAWCKAAAPGMSGADLFHVAALAGAGDTGGAHRAMRDVECEYAGRYVSPVYRATALAALGDEDAAIEFVARAAAERDYWLPNVYVDPVFDDLRARPEFTAILQCAGLFGAIAGASSASSAPQVSAV